MPQRTESERERLRRISILNARLPKKRTIAQGVLRNPAGEVLLCELSYKKEWDLPGGVVDPGESPATCVEREVEEELGIRARIVRALEPVRYRTPKGRDKEVRYWVMEPVSGEFTPNDEVDDVRWLAPDEARSALSYEADRTLIENL